MDTSQAVEPGIRQRRARRSEASMGFASTAIYFQERARKARDYHDRQMFNEVAEFYRRLANIAPDFPPGFHGGRFISKATRYQKRAEECRAMAEHFKSEDTRRMMMDLATTYDLMARSAE
jgi:hypothetical protein